MPVLLFAKKQVPVPKKTSARIGEISALRPAQGP